MEPQSVPPRNPEPQPATPEATQDGEALPTFFENPADQSVLSTQILSCSGAILLVEPDPASRASTAHFLEAQGHGVLLAETGEEALRMARLEMPDLVILACALPDISGFDTCQLLKQDPDLQHIPVLMSSAREDLWAQLKCLDAGAQDVLTKPCETALLLARIRSQLRLGQAMKALDMARRRLAMRVNSTNRELMATSLDLLREEKEKNQAWQRLNEAHAENAQLVASIPSILIGIDPAGLVCHWNGVAQATFGLALDQVRGRPFETLALSWDQTRVRSSIQECQRLQEPVKLEDLPFRRLDGKSGTLGLTLCPFSTGGPRSGGILLFGADITARKTLEQQFLQAQKMEAIGFLASGVAHDFNNILMIIMGQCQMLQRGGPEDSRRPERVAEIYECANRAAALTRQLLAFTRQEVCKPERLDLNRELHDILRMLRRLLREEIQLDFQPGAGLGTVLLDRSQFTQVVLNLAVNASDAMARGGRLSLTTRLASPEEIAARLPMAAPAGRMACLAIRDTGVGMSEEVQARIFEPFFTTKAKGKGTGLGLATVYGVVTQSGGRILVESSPGAGTCFEIFWPLEGEGAEGPPSAEAPQANEGGRESILVVEDEEGLRELLVEMLEAMGYRVTALADPREALARERQGLAGQPDLLLTDLVLPAMGGDELALELWKTRPGLQVLFMSGHAESGVLNRATLKDSRAFLQKPFTQQDLAAKLRQLLNK